ncbi:3-hydroxyacyl-CoA dehydrogenase [Betaproteobacteria bacterium GR16-43]|nr:3-hydroxyacyl-CoA dehydrogenase [Betaproteobacteria bacterium GR16-43]
MNPLRTTAVIGGGTMGADVAHTLVHAGCETHVVEPVAALRDAIAKRLPAAKLHASLETVPWPRIGAVIEAIPERLEPKRALFTDLVRLAPADALLTSNSSAIPIGKIGEGLATRERMFGLHYFMPAHQVPLVEVIYSEASDAALGDALCDFMRATGKVPVKVRKDVPGFLANRLKHALCREAFALIDAGVATAEDVDLAVRFGFGFRFIAAGPVLQRDLAGLDVHCAAAATIYPDLAAGTKPAKVLADHVAAGHHGMKSGRGFFEWTPERAQRERERYARRLEAALALVADDLQ